MSCEWQFVLPPHQKARNCSVRRRAGRWPQRPANCWHEATAGGVTDSLPLGRAAMNRAGVRYQSVTSRARHRQVPVSSRWCCRCPGPCRNVGAGSPKAPSARHSTAARALAARFSAARNSGYCAAWLDRPGLPGRAVTPTSDQWAPAKVLSRASVYPPLFPALLSIPVATVPDIHYSTYSTVQEEQSESCLIAWMRWDAEAQPASRPLLPRRLVTWPAHMCSAGNVRVPPRPID